MFLKTLFFLTFAFLSFFDIHAQTNILPFDSLKVKPQLNQNEKTNQNTKKIQIIYSDSLIQKTDTITDTVERSLKGNVKLLHDGAYMYCNIATLFPQTNYLEAHGNVRITKGDSIKINSKELRYYGDNKMAYLEKDVKVNNKGNILTAPLISYDIDNEIGYFYNNGKLVSDSTVLTSESGVHYQREEYAVFKGDVVLKSPDYVMYADSMIYRTDTKIARFITRTIIISENDTIITDKGYFDTQHNKAVLEGRSSVKRGNDYKLTSDKINYDKTNKSGVAIGNAVSVSKKDNAYILANYLEYNDSTQYTFATRDPLMIQRDEKDTLYISADSLFNFTVSHEEYQKQYQPKTPNNSILGTVTDSNFVADTGLVEVNPADSLNIKVDTLIDDIEIIDSLSITTDSLINTSSGYFLSDTSKILDSSSTQDQSIGQIPFLEEDSVKHHLSKPDSVKIFYGYKNVKLIRSNMSGVCDSIYFDSRDSIFKLYKNPILWMDSTQLKSDSIYIFMKDGNAERIELYQNATIISEDEPHVFNQISGKKITGWLDSNKLKKVLVDGNAESIYFLKNDSSEFIGGNQSESALIWIFMDDSNKIEKLRLEGDPKSVFTPIRQINFSTYRLGNFDWYMSYKPKTKWDVIRDTLQYQKFLMEYPPDTTNIKLDTTFKLNDRISTEDIPPIEELPTESKSEKDKISPNVTGQEMPFRKEKNENPSENIQEEFDNIELPKNTPQNKRFKSRTPLEK